MVVANELFTTMRKDVDLEMAPVQKKHVRSFRRPGDKHPAKLKHEGTGITGASSSLQLLYAGREAGSRCRGR